MGDLPEPRSAQRCYRIREEESNSRVSAVPTDEAAVPTDEAAVPRVQNIRLSGTLTHTRTHRSRSHPYAPAGFIQMLAVSMWLGRTERTNLDLLGHHAPAQLSFYLRAGSVSM